MVYGSWFINAYSTQFGRVRITKKMAKMKNYLLQFLKEETQIKMKREQAQEDFNLGLSAKKTETKVKKVKNVSADLPTNVGLLSQNVCEKISCVFCDKGNHQSSQCFKGKKMSLEEKKTLMRNRNVCFICLLSCLEGVTWELS